MILHQINLSKSRDLKKASPTSKEEMIINNNSKKENSLIEMANQEKKSD